MLDVDGARDSGSLRPLAGLDSFRVEIRGVVFDEVVVQVETENLVDAAVAVGVKQEVVQIVDAAVRCLAVVDIYVDESAPMAVVP